MAANTFRWPTRLAYRALKSCGPDSLLTRLNRISDFGYRVNRVVARQSSDTTIAFFPIERFLTPNLKRIFTRQPALFFNTGLALVDPNPEMTAILERVSGKRLAELTTQLPAMVTCAGSGEADACQRSAGLMSLLRATSLNSIQVIVDGSLMVEALAVPPSIDGVGSQGNRIVVTGNFLSGARLVIDPVDAGMEWVATDAAQSTTAKLVGQLRFTHALVPGTTFFIRAVRDTADGQQLSSAAFPYVPALH